MLPQARLMVRGLDFVLRCPHGKFLIHAEQKPALPSALSPEHYVAAPNTTPHRPQSPGGNVGAEGLPQSRAVKAGPGRGGGGGRHTLSI